MQNFVGKVIVIGNEVGIFSGSAFQISDIKYGQSRLCTHQISEESCRGLAEKFLHYFALFPLNKGNRSDMFGQQVTGMTARSTEKQNSIIALATNEDSWAWEIKAERSGSIGYGYSSRTQMEKKLIFFKGQITANYYVLQTTVAWET